MWNAKNTVLTRNAAKCIMEQNYLHDKKKSYPPKVHISPYVLMAKFYSPISALTGYKELCKATLSDSLYLTTFPKIKIPYSYELLREEENTINLNGDVISFSPLITTNNKNEYCMLCEIENYESSSTFLYMLKKEKNQQFKIIKTIDGIIKHN